jgi:hypothetical protein
MVGTRSLILGRRGFGRRRAWTPARRPPPRFARPTLRPPSAGERRVAGSSGGALGGRRGKGRRWVALVEPALNAIYLAKEGLFAKFSGAARPKRSPSRAFPQSFREKIPNLALI